VGDWILAWELDGEEAAQRYREEHTDRDSLRKGRDDSWMSYRFRSEVKQLCPTQKKQFLYAFFISFLMQ